MNVLHKNEELERDLVHLREDLNKSLRWTISSQILSILTSQGVNNSKGFRYQYKTQSSGSQGKVVQDVRNKVHKPLCTHYGRDGHMKKNCQSWLRS